MLQIHPNARSGEPTGLLAQRHVISTKTIRKWHKHGASDCLDPSAKFYRLPWRAAEEECAFVCDVRRATNFPLDNLTFVVSHFLPHLNRHSIWRILKAEGLNRRVKPVVKRPIKGQGTFKDYDFGFIHIDIKHLPKLQTVDGERRKRYLFVAIDRSSHSVHFAVKDDETEKSVIAFLSEAAAGFPFRLTHMLTDNGSGFTLAFVKTCADLRRSSATPSPRPKAWPSASTAASAARCRGSTSIPTVLWNRDCAAATPAASKSQTLGRAGSCNTTKARLIAEAAKEVSQPNKV